MKTVMISVIGVSSLLLVILTQTAINEQSVYEEELNAALSTAMKQTMTEVFERNCYGMTNRNEMIAAFLQAMTKKVSDRVSLTVRIHSFDEQKGIMDVEAIGTYVLPDFREKSISVHRKMKLELKKEEMEVE